MSEFIIIQDRGNIIVGQCGNQIGGQFWNLALQEYGVLNVSDASSSFAERQSRVFRKDFHSFKGGTHHESFFWNHGFSDLVSSGHQGERKEKKIKAKAVLVDMEDGVVSQLLNSKYGHLFDKELKLTYFPGSGNNWAVGHKMHGKHFHETLSCIISRAVEKCDHLQGFILLCSLGGGTGSGLGSYILKILEENFSNVERFVGCVYPEENDDVITSPYNVLFATRELTEHATCVFPFDNKALINICNKISQQVTIRKPVTTNLIPNDLPSTSKPFQDMNSIIANMLLHLTCSARFPGSLNLDINEIYSNMVPFSKMHYISSGLSPLFNLNYNTSKANRQDEIFTSCWSRQNQLCRSIDPMNSTLLAVSLIGRGSITMSEMRKNIERLQTKAKFAPWSTESMKVGLCSVPITSIPSSLLCLFNSTGITNLFTDTLKKFSKLYHRKAHLHHYLVEGMEMADIAECQASMQEVIDLYRGVNTILPDDVISSLKIW